MSSEIVKDLRTELKEKSKSEVRKSFNRFFKKEEEIKCYGLKSGEVRVISQKYYKKIKDLPKEKIFELCENLLSSGYTEETFIASSWCYKLKNFFTESDFELFKNWVDKYIDNWAKCDSFCCRNVGALIEKYPDCARKLKKWAKSKNKWLMRASAVSLINVAKKGKYLEEIFEICDILLVEKEDLVQKGYGWLLKVSSKKNEDKVFEYVLLRKDKMPKTSLRYAIENMPSDRKKLLMEK